MTTRINFNGETVRFTTMAAGADVAPEITVDYTLWPNSVDVANISNYPVWEQKMKDVFAECGANVSNITFETI